MAFFSASKGKHALGGRLYSPVRILKQDRGLDPDAYEHYASFCRQDYLKYELCFAAETIWRSFAGH